MRTYLHFLKSNLLYNKVELSFSYGLTGLVFCVYFYLQEVGSEAMTGMNFVSIAFYALLYAFFSNKKKFNLKYLVSLPMSKAQMLVVKTCSDIVFFAPFICLGFAGGILLKIEVHPIALLILLFQAAIMASLILFDSDVEQPRVENTKASFVNRLVFIRNKLDFVFSLGIVGGIGAVVFVSKIDEATAGLILVVIGFLGIGLKFYQSLRLLKDESLSYFIVKRDMFKMGLKASLIAAPIVFMHLNSDKLNSPFGSNKVFESIVKNDLETLEKYVETGELPVSKGYTPLLVAGRVGNVEAFNLIYSKAESSIDDIVSGKKFFGYGVAHLSALSNNLSMMERVLSIRPDALDMKTSQSKTPLMVAASNCKAEMVDYLLHKGANPNIQTGKGETALILAAKRSCIASTALLLEYNANPLVKDKKGKMALDYFGENSKLKYLFKRKMPKEHYEAKRALASEEKL